MTINVYLGKDGFYVTKADLIAPMESGDKKTVLDYLKKYKFPVFIDKALAKEFEEIKPKKYFVLEGKKPVFVK